MECVQVIDPHLVCIDIPILPEGPNRLPAFPIQKHKCVDMKADLRFPVSFIGCIRMLQQLPAVTVPPRGNFPLTGGNRPCFRMGGQRLPFDRVDVLQLLTGRAYTVGDYQSKKEVPEQLRVLFNLAIYAGLRKGELLALEWSDIDFENNTVSVTKAVSVVAGQQITKAPKTKNSRRVVSIPASLTRRIQHLKTDRFRYRLSLGDYWKGASWIFIQHDGKQMSYSTPYAALQDILQRYNEGKPEAKQLPPIPFHGLRHTSATLLIAGNQMDMRTVSSRLGHAQASTTINIYAHALQEMDRKAVDALEQMLAKEA